MKNLKNDVERAYGLTINGVPDSVLEQYENIVVTVTYEKITQQLLTNIWMWLDDKS